MRSASKWTTWTGAAGATVIAVFWLARRAFGTQARSAVGAHSSLVPIDEARLEAQRTRQAFVHSSESHHKG